MRSPLVVAVLAAATAVSGADAATCTRLPDSFNTLLTLAKSLGGVGSLGVDLEAKELVAALTTIDTELPWMSQCLGSVDAVSLYATIALSSGFSACNASISTAMSTLKLPGDLTDDQALRDRVCPFYGATAMPCLNKLVVQSLVDAMTSMESCCDDMKTEMKKQFGADLKTVVADLLNKVVAAVCTIKTFPNAAGKATTQTCLASMFESFLAPKASSNLQLLVQLPTDQACQAMAGESFTTTRPVTAQFNWKDLPVDGFGICYEPLSQLIKHVGSYPMMASVMTANGASASMADVFAPGACVKLKSYVDDSASSSIPVRWMRVADAVAAAVVGVLKWDATEYSKVKTMVTDLTGTADSPTCVHLASGQTCIYTTATTVLGYQTPRGVAASPTLSPNGPATPTSPTTSSSKSTAVSAVSLSTATAIFTTVLGMMVFAM